MKHKTVYSPSLVYSETNYRIVTLATFSVILTHDYFDLLTCYFSIEKETFKSLIYSVFERLALPDIYRCLFVMFNMSVLSYWQIHQGTRPERRLSYSTILSIFTFIFSQIFSTLFK